MASARAARPSAAAETSSESPVLTRSSSPDSRMAAIMGTNCMERTLDVRGLACPLPLVKARAALAGLAPGDVLVVLATDPEAPIDLAALAADEGLALATRARGRSLARDARRSRPARPRRTHTAGPGGAAT